MIYNFFLTSIQLVTHVTDQHIQSEATWSNMCSLKKLLKSWLWPMSLCCFSFCL